MTFQPFQYPRKANGRPSALWASTNTRDQEEYFYCFAHKEGRKNARDYLRAVFERRDDLAAMRKAGYERIKAFDPDGPYVHGWDSYLRAERLLADKRMREANARASAYIETLVQQ